MLLIKIQHNLTTLTPNSELNTAGRTIEETRNETDLVISNNSI